MAASLPAYAIRFMCVQLCHLCGSLWHSGLVCWMKTCPHSPISLWGVPYQKDKSHTDGLPASPVFSWAPETTRTHDTGISPPSTHCHDDLVQGSLSYILDSKWSLLLPLPSSNLEVENRSVTDPLRINTSLIFQSKLHTSILPPPLPASQVHMPHSRRVHYGLTTELFKLPPGPLLLHRWLGLPLPKSSICSICLGREPTQNASDLGEITYGTLELPPLGEPSLHSQIGFPLH